MNVILRRKKISKGRFSLYLDIYHNGKRSYQFLKLYLTKDKELNKEVLQLAEKVRARYLIDIQTTSYGFIPDFKKHSNFVDYFEKVVQELPKDRSSLQCTLRHLKIFTQNKIAFAEINEIWLEDFKKYLISQVAQTTAHHYFANIKTVLNKALREKIININPCNSIPGIKLPSIQRNYLELNEIEKLISVNCNNKEVKKCFLFSCFTGLRYSDIRNLKWENIKGDQIEYRQKKTNNVEYLPLSITAKNILLSCIKDNIIPHPSTKVFSIPTKGITSVHIKTWVQNAGITKKISFHSSRHTFATLSLTQGIDLYTVSKLLGHSNIATTQIYAKIVDQKKKEAIEKLPVVNIQI